MREGGRERSAARVQFLRGSRINGRSGRRDCCSLRCRGPLPHREEQAMRYVESRAQWEHTLEQEEDSGWSKVTDEDMPPSLVKLLDAKHARLVEVADKLQAARARLEKAEELL